MKVIKKVVQDRDVSPKISQEGNLIAETITIEKKQVEEWLAEWQ